MKIFLAFLFAFTSAAAVADNATTTPAAKVAAVDHSNYGLMLGAAYMNITDIHVNSALGNSNVNSGYASGTSLGMGGVVIGYNHTPEEGVGFIAEVQVLQNMSLTGGSTYGGRQVNVYLPELNVTVAINKSIYAFLGLNSAVWSDTAPANYFKNQMGQELGAGFRFNRNLSLQAEYTMMGEIITDPYFGLNSPVSVQISGFNSSLFYTF